MKEKLNHSQIEQRGPAYVWLKLLNTIGQKALGDQSTGASLNTGQTGGLARTLLTKLRDTRAGLISGERHSVKIKDPYNE